MSGGKRDWSLVTAEQFKRYTREAQGLIEYAVSVRIHPFAAAVAGVALIRNAFETMGGKIEWWAEFVRTGNLPPPTPANDSKAGEA